MPISKTYTLAGNATFTIDAPDKHRTYKVVRKEATERFPEAFFVSTLTGPDNEGDFTYMGLLDPFTGQVRTTAKSKNWEGTMRLRLLNRVLARVWSDDHAAYEQHGYATHHEGKCGRCGRKLTTPKSVTTGIGPECAKVIGLAA